MPIRFLLGRCEPDRHRVKFAVLDRKEVLWDGVEQVVGEDDHRVRHGTGTQFPARSAQADRPVCRGVEASEVQAALLHERAQLGMLFPERDVALDEVGEDVGEPDVLQRRRVVELGERVEEVEPEPSAPCAQFDDVNRLTRVEVGLPIAQETKEDARVRGCDVRTRANPEGDAPFAPGGDALALVVPALELPDQGF